MAVNPQMMARGGLLGITMFGLAAAWSPTDAPACGYHDSVSMARGLLNWIYPDALHVIGAISAAVAEKRLPPPAVTPDLFGVRGYHATARALGQFAGQLSSLQGDAPPAFSLLLIEPMLWTRFTSDGGTWRAEIHVSGPQQDDVVLISGEDVIREIAGGRLALADARQLGLVRLYGPERQVAQFVGSYADAGYSRPGESARSRSDRKDP